MVGFLPSTTPTCCGGGGSGRGSIATASIIGEPGYQLSSRSPTPSIIPIGRTVTARSIVPLNAAREDCKSCIEQELATQEGIAGKDFDERRKLLKEVRTVTMTKSADYGRDVDLKLNQQGPSSLSQH